MHAASHSSSQWESHACCAKALFRAHYDGNEEYTAETALLFNWVFYHDALAKFSRRHWIAIDSEQQKLCVKTNPLIRSKNMLSPSKGTASLLPTSSDENADPSRIV
jgi:hypothetical protein